MFMKVQKGPRITFDFSIIRSSLCLNDEIHVIIVEGVDRMINKHVCRGLFFLSSPHVYQAIRTDQLQLPLTFVVQTQYRKRRTT